MGRYSVVINRATGEAVSWCTAGKEAPRDVLEARGLEVVDVGEHPEPGPDLGAHRWDPAARRLVPRVKRDRLEDIDTAPELADLGDVLRGLPTPQRARALRGLERLLGPLRFRDEHEPPALG